MCVCVCERERERETCWVVNVGWLGVGVEKREYVCEKERENMWGRERERDYMVCVCVFVVC